MLIVEFLKLHDLFFSSSTKTQSYVFVKKSLEYLVLHDTY